MNALYKILGKFLILRLFGRKTGFSFMNHDTEPLDKMQLGALKV